MKKVLLASTALVATSGFAMAQGVELSGYAEIGIADGGGPVGVEFWSDLDVKFSLSGETDNGLTFGATIDLDEVGDDGCGGINAAPRGACSTEEHSVFVSGSFGTITMGDTDGAFDFAMSEVGGLTALADDHTSHSGFTGNGGLDGSNDGQILRYDYSFGDFTVAASLEMDDGGLNGGGDVIGVGGRWSGDFGGTDLAVGLAYQENDFTDVTGISVRAGFGDITAILNYSDWSTGSTHTGIGVTYTTGALSLHANYGEFDCAGCDGFGVAANYDLGGGAVAMIGYGDSGGVAGNSRFSAGLGLSF